MEGALAGKAATTARLTTIASTDEASECEGVFILNEPCA